MGAESWSSVFSCNLSDGKYPLPQNPLTSPSSLSTFIARDTVTDDTWHMVAIERTEGNLVEFDLRTSLMYTIVLCSDGDVLGGIIKTSQQPPLESDRALLIFLSSKRDPSWNNAIHLPFALTEKEISVIPSPSISVRMTLEISASVNS